LWLGAIYLIGKFVRTNDEILRSNKDNIGNIVQNSQSNQEEMSQTDKIKEEHIQSIHERHIESAEIMADSYKNIAKDVESLEFDKDSVMGSESAEIIDELDSLSDELDEILR